MLAAAAGVVWGCGDDPLAEGAGDNLQLVGDPTALFITAGDLERMVVELKDAQGTSVQTTFAISNVSSGISVEVDESFVPVFSPDGELLPPTSPTRVRLNITAANIPPSIESFDVTAEGQTKTFTIQIAPADMAATFSTLTPGIGEVVTVTASSGLLFTEGTHVSFPGFPDAIVTDVAADGSTISFIAVPGSMGVPSFSEVATTALAPNLTFTVPATSEMTSAPMEPVFSDLTPDAGQAVTVTAAGFQFLATTKVVIGDEISANVAVAGDGSSLTFVPRPGIAGILSFEDIELTVLPGTPLTIPTAVYTVGGTVAAAIPGTDDPGTAPVVNLPTEPGLSAVFTDQFNLVDQFYNFTVVADGHYTIELFWAGGGGAGNDVDLFTSEGNAFTTDNPEGVDTGALTAGHIIETLAEQYNTPGNPAWLQMVVTKVD
ncbi:MAG TPA: hypothetical protein VLA95_05480 [Gemmatimonadales bacterium]|nr:hypothetical protein [Gemmatimonadales bacterium]